MATVSNIRGMYPSGKSSVKRHIENLHSGNANVVSFLDYLVGRKIGLYWPSYVPTYQRKNTDISKGYTSIIKDELLRQSIEREHHNLNNDKLLWQ